MTKAKPLASPNLAKAPTRVKRSEQPSVVDRGVCHREGHPPMYSTSLCMGKQNAGVVSSLTRCRLLELSSSGSKLLTRARKRDRNSGPETAVACCSLRRNPYDNRNRVA
jgi:hypothetical protein